MGFFWAILCGFAFGIGDTLTRLGVRSSTPFTGAIISSSVMALFFLFPVLSQDLGGRPLWPAIGWFLAMGAAATAPGRLLFYFSLRRIGVSRASILVTISPLVSMLFAVAFLGERPTGWVVLGAILIFVGVLSFTMDKTSIPDHPRRRPAGPSAHGILQHDAPVHAGGDAIPAEPRFGNLSGRRRRSGRPFGRAGISPASGPLGREPARLRLVRGPRVSATPRRFSPFTRPSARSRSASSRRSYSPLRCSRC